MFLILSLITTSFGNDAEIIIVPLPDAAVEALPEATPWQDPTEIRTGPPIAWTQIGDHRIGDEHLLYDDNGRVTLSCKIQAFELRSAETGAWVAGGVEVWARLDCGTAAVASR